MLRLLLLLLCALCVLSVLQPACCQQKGVHKHFTKPGCLLLMHVPYLFAA